MDSKVLDTMPCTEKLLNLLIEVNSEALARVCAAYGCTDAELRDYLNTLLPESGMHLGACSRAVGFLVVATDQAEMEPTIKDAIQQSIFGAAVYYANGIGVDPTYKPTYK